MGKESGVPAIAWAAELALVLPGRRVLSEANAFGASAGLYLPRPLFLASASKMYI